MADKVDGHWCKACKQRHGYMTMRIGYERFGQTFRVLWFCKKTGNQIGELILGNTIQPDDAGELAPPDSEDAGAPGE